MTYPAFLLIFLVLPIVALAAGLVLVARGEPRGRALWLPALAHSLIAVVYTTPWDNFLVATRVWWYDPAKVWGLRLGWVPLEEYLFFALQPLLAALWLRALAGVPALRPAGELPANGARLRTRALAAAGAVWLGSLALLASGWRPGTYLGLELAWALPPIMLQLAVGADILWQHRRQVGLALGSLSLYLILADSIAIRAGTWVIDPAQSLPWRILHMPIEEIVFFTLTNTLVMFGLALWYAPETKARLGEWHRALREQSESKAITAER